MMKSKFHQPNMFTMLCCKKATTVLVFLILFFEKSALCTPTQLKVFTSQIVSDINVINARIPWMNAFVAKSPLPSFSKVSISESSEPLSSKNGAPFYSASFLENRRYKLKVRSAVALAFTGISAAVTGAIFLYMDGKCADDACRNVHSLKGGGIGVLGLSFGLETGALVLWLLRKRHVSQ